MSAVTAPAGMPLAASIQDVTRASAERFEQALAEPDKAQSVRLDTILRGVAGSRQARRIAGFDRVRTAREFQDAVPFSTAESMAPDVERLALGEQRTLTHEPVLRFELTGGSSGASKLVPYTAGLLREFHNALLPWFHDLARSRPRAWAGRAYWTISPLGQRRETTPGGLAVGGADDASYLPSAFRRAIAPAFAVPGAVAQLADVDVCRYVTLRLLLECPDLSFVSAWSPTFLTLLMQTLDTHRDRLLDDLATGCCRPPTGDREDEATVAGMSFGAHPERVPGLGHDGPAAWPELSLISVWTDAQAARFLPELAQRFPGVEIQGKGLLATEGVVSIPWLAAPAPVLAVRSHFLEFIDIEQLDARPLLAHEIEAGRTYEVVVTTSSGMLRYRLGDRVRVEGFALATPCVRFVGRNRVSDLVGEKLAASRVESILARVVGDGARFTMLAPEPGSPPAYHLYVESGASDADVDAWARGVERELLESFPYRYARELGQLAPVRAVRVDDAGRRYEAACVARGQRSGDVKPVALETRPGWMDAMTEAR